MESSYNTGFKVVWIIQRHRFLRNLFLNILLCTKIKCASKAFIKNSPTVRPTFPEASTQPPIELPTNLKARGKLDYAKNILAFLSFSTWQRPLEEGGWVISISITNGVQWGSPVSAKSFELQLQQKKKSLFLFGPRGLWTFCPDTKSILTKSNEHDSRFTMLSVLYLVTPATLPCHNSEWLNKKVKVDKMLREMNILTQLCAAFFFV